MKKFYSFREFYPFYLSEHTNRISRLLHFIGTCGVLIMLFMAIKTTGIAWFILIPICGYGFAWIGHFFFEKNEPATFKYPFYSLLGDWMMFKDMLVGKVKF